MAALVPTESRESLPCPAPTPLPRPPTRCWSPDPEVALTPERSCSGRPGGGILRRQQEGKLPRRHVRFRIGANVEELGETHFSLPSPAEGGQGNQARPHVARMVKKELWESPFEGGSPPALNRLAAPVAHSSLALGAEAQTVREQAFHARQAAAELIQRSFVARCAVDTHVGEGVNIPRDQQLYRGLISLQVPVDDLLSSAVQERLALVQHHPRSRKEADSAGPDLRAFYMPAELFTETPFLEVEGLPPLKLQARRREPATTFFMYRKLQQWKS